MTVTGRKRAFAVCAVSPTGVALCLIAVALTSSTSPLHAGQQGAADMKVLQHALRRWRRGADVLVRPLDGLYVGGDGLAVRQQRAKGPMLGCQIGCQTDQRRHSEQNNGRDVSIRRRR